MNLWNETKSVPVSREMIWAAYKKVKANKGSAGVDEISMEEFDAERSKHLYKLWNRMASGSYFPPPVKEVEIPKKDGKVRKLGVPTIADRIGQMAIKDYLEARFEKIFSSSSYGYRPNRNAHQALEQVRNNCRKTDWVIDLDIKGFFDNIDHGKLLLALEKHMSENWCSIYIKRWLTAPVQKKSGELVQKQGKGTPQGGVITPCTHLLTLNLYGELLLIGENFKFVIFIKSSIFAINEKIAEFRIGRTDQSGICFIERIQTARGGEIINKKVWSIPDTGVSLYSIGQGTQRKDDNTGKFGGIYCEITLQFNQSGKRVGRNSGSYHQQIDKTGAGRIFSEAGKWQKRSNNLRYPVFMTGYGSKSSHRPTISLYQRTRWLLTRRILLKLN